MSRDQATTGGGKAAGKAKAGRASDGAGGKKDAPRARKKPKKVPAGLAAFTDGGTVPGFVVLARVVLLLAFAATIPTILGVEHGRRLFWAAAIASLPLFWVVGGYHLWRRICPLAVVSQLGRLFGRPGTRRVQGWLAEHYLRVQLGFMFVALALRLIMTNGTPMALVGFLAAASVIAAVVGFIFTGKTWCNYFCPVGAVEKMYTEPARLAGLGSSKCNPCTACKKNCPDIDLEQGYWKELDMPARRDAYFAWPGLVFGFYFYFYLVAGNWDYYFSGAWTLEDLQASRWLAPGLYFLQSVPVVIAAPLTLAGSSLASYLVFRAGEGVALRAARRRATGDADPARRVRHRALALAGFVGFLTFYFYGGQPTVRLAPSWVGPIFAVLVAIAATTIFWSRWRREEEEFVRERFAEKILKRWEWGEQPPSDRLQDIYLVHTERTKEREARIGAYKETVREMVADGLVTRNELVLLDSLRAQLGVTDKDHKRVLNELSEEERQLFDPDYQGSIEERLQHEQYENELERAVVGAARLGQPPDRVFLDTIGDKYNVSPAEHEAAVSQALGPEGPIARVVDEELTALAPLLAAHRASTSREVASSTSFGFLRYVCQRVARARLERAVNLLGVLRDRDNQELTAHLWARDPERGEAARSRLRQLGELGARAADVIVSLAAVTEHDHSVEPAALKPLASDSNAYLRAVAVHLLSRYDDVDSRSVVEAATEDDEALVRESAFNAMGIRGRLKRALMSRALADPSPEVRRAAIQSMGRGSGQQDAMNTQLAMEKAEQAETQGIYATLDANARIDSLTKLEKMMFLRMAPMFGDVDPDDLEMATAFAVERHYRAGDDLCAEGASGSEVFLIVSGSVEAWRRNGSERRVLGTSGPGGCIGEMAVLDPAPRSATVTAVEATRTLVVSGDDFQAMLLSRPAMAQSIISVLVGRLRGMIR